MEPSTSSIDIRPTLPSIHTLGLLPDALSVDNRCLSASPSSDNSWNDFARWRRARQSSISSTTSSCTTSASRPPSPSDIDALKHLHVATSALASPNSSQSPSNAFSLVLTTFDKANAFVVVPPSTPYVPNISSYSRSTSSSNSEKRHAQRNRALLLVGPAVEYVRHNKLRITRGARVHPYRIVPSPARRTSTSSQSPANPPSLQ